MAYVGFLLSTVYSRVYEASSDQRELSEWERGRERARKRENMKINETNKR